MSINENRKEREVDLLSEDAIRRGAEVREAELQALRLQEAEKLLRKSLRPGDPVMVPVKDLRKERGAYLSGAELRAFRVLEAEKLLKIGNKHIAHGYKVINDGKDFIRRGEHCLSMRAKIMEELQEDSWPAFVFRFVVEFGISYVWAYIFLRDVVDPWLDPRGKSDFD